MTAAETAVKVNVSLGDVTMMVPIDRIHVSRTNPRRTLEVPALMELADSIRTHGVLQPILVRSLANGELELVAGHRRLEAAQIAELAEIPAVVRTMTDTEALEAQIVENMQRADLHPLEEADGYSQLVAKGFDAAKISARTGRSVKYVYDRLKLQHLGKSARKLLMDGTLTPGHAILLARISEKDQERALEVGACLHREQLLWDSSEDDVAPDTFRAVSVRELQAWIDKHVRFGRKDADPMLFPETALTLETTAGKVVAITFLNYIPDEARDGKTYGPRSWARADGTQHSKTCKHSVTGFVAVGPRRGEAFPVCIAKEKCEVHWGEQIRARQARAAAGGTVPAKAPAAPAPPKVDEKRAEALRAAERTAVDAIVEAGLKAAGALKPVAALRALALLSPWPIANYLDHMNLPRGRDREAAWVRKAPVTELQRALLRDAIDLSSENAFCSVLGVNAKAIRKEHVKRAEQALKATTSKPAPAKPAAATKKKAKSHNGGRKK